MYTTHQEKVKRKFDDVVAYIKGNSTISARTKLAKKLLNPYRCNSILDIGCGDGSISIGLSSTETKLQLVDLSENMLEIAKEKAVTKGIKNLIIFQGDVIKFRANKTFDLVVCLGVLAHVPSIEATIQTITEHLDSNGKAILQFTEKNSLQGWIAYRWFRQASPLYKVNDTSFKLLYPILELNKLKVIDKLRYSESSMGTSILGISFSTKFKVFSSNLGIVSNLFSGSILLLEKE